MHIQLNKVTEYINITFFLLFKQVNFSIDIMEIYPRIPLELVVYPLVSAEHTLVITALNYCMAFWDSSMVDGRKVYIL